MENKDYWYFYDRILETPSYVKELKDYQLEKLVIILGKSIQKESTQAALIEYANPEYQYPEGTTSKIDYWKNASVGKYGYRNLAKVDQIVKTEYNKRNEVSKFENPKLTKPNSGRAWGRILIVLEEIQAIKPEERITIQKEMSEKWGLSNKGASNGYSDKIKSKNHCNELRDHFEQMPYLEEYKHKAIPWIDKKSHNSEK